MELLDWIFIGLLSLAILSFVFSLISGGLALKLRNKIKISKNKRFKNKQKRKRNKRQISKLERQKKKQVSIWLLFMTVFVVTISGAFYSRYYQSTNLGSEDANAIAQGYNLTKQIEEQLSQINEDDANVEKIHKNIYELSSQLSSYGVRKANGRISQEGQLLLNRLYTNMKELGLNLSNQSVDNLTDSTLMEGYLTDIEKIKQNQQKVFDYFRIDKAMLQTK